jgi:cell division protein FtsB
MGKLTRQVLIKIIPVIGSIVLFLAWVFQQTLLGEANNASQQIANAQSVFQTYQSNNALFNAIVQTIKSDSASIDQIRRVQIYNYELGLRELEALLDNEAKATIPSPPNPFSGTSDADAMMRVTQERINTIQGKLSKMREKIAGRKASLNIIFLVLYAIGSLTVLIGSVVAVLQSTKASEGQTSANKK